MTETEVQEMKNLADRQDEMEKGLQTIANDMLKITAQAVSDNERFKLIEQQTERFEAEIRELKDSTRVMQRLFDQLGSKIDGLETRLFTWLQKSQTDSGKERQATQKMWITFAQFIIGGTVFALVTAFTAQMIGGR